MGIFDGKPKKTEEEKLKEVLDKYGLDISNYDEKKIGEENRKNLNQIANDIVGNKWFKAGMAFSFASADKQATVGYLSALVSQNWILIRQNELIIKKLSEKK